MPGLQLDSLTPSPLDFPPAPRCEPRPEESFEDHLRRTPERAPAQQQQPTRDSEQRPAERDSASEAARQPAQEASHERASSPHEAARRSESEKTKGYGKSKDEDSSLSAADSAGANQGQPQQQQTPAAAAAIKEHAEAELAVLADKDSVAKNLESAGKSRCGGKPTASKVRSQGKEKSGAKDVATGTETVTESALPETAVDTGAEHAGLHSKDQGSAKSGKAIPTPTKPVELAASKADGKAESDDAADREHAASAGDQTAAIETDQTDGRKERGERHAKGQEEHFPQLDSQTQSEPTDTAAPTTGSVPNVDSKADASQDHASAAGETAASPTQSDAVAGPTGRLPQHLLSRATEHAPAGKPLTEADQTRFVQRVARAFQTAANEEGELRLRLSPPELGSLRLEVKVQGGVMTARIEAESSAARSLLLDNLPALRERLADQNIRLEQFDVDLMDRQPGGQPQGTPQDHNRQTNGPADAAIRFRGTEETADEPLAAPSSPRGTSPGKLNVLV